MTMNENNMYLITTTATFDGAYGVSIEQSETVKNNANDVTVMAPILPIEIITPPWRTTQA
ncbi:hypothetical protein [Lysobacter sp. FW306-1B-D06B]|uniref:hypothetical protein n=1 Tax=Lysobacter sp. FW306-1B-D06B TaxID=3140250 RepID=UPI0031401483